MLRDHYECDPRFWRIIEELAIEMDPELAQIDRLLEDDELYQLIRQDFARRYPKTEETGRSTIPVEVTLRMLAVKRLYDWSYRTTQWQVGDSLVLRWFCRLYFEPVPDHSTLQRWAQPIQPETLQAFNERLTTLAVQAKVTRGRKLRTDGTVVQSNVHYPTDSRLLLDGVRVLGRTLTRAKQVVGQQVERAQQVFRNRTRSAKQAARRIAEGARQRSQQATATVRTSYQRLVETARATVRQAHIVWEALQADGSQPAQRLAHTLETFVPRLEQVIDQTVRRVFAGEGVPAAEKLVSLFEPHADIIVRGKADHPVEFGHKVWLDEVDGGIITRWQVLDGNPPDTEQWRPALDYHLAQFEKPPDQMSGDRGMWSPDNEAYAQQQGVKHPVLPKAGYKSQARKHHERQAWFQRGRRFHAGIEGRIHVCKHKYGLERCPDHGRDGFERYVGWGIIAHNLAKIGTALAA